MEQLQTRLDALEQRTHIVERQLRWWRGLAGSLLVLAVLTWVLPSGTAQEDASNRGERGLAQRVAGLEDLFKNFSRVGNDVFITGLNVHIVNGLGRTDCGPEGAEIPDCPNGVGNLIVGYNESREPDFGTDVRTGSHNVVVGRRHNFSRFGGVVVGDLNEISGDFAAVTGGRLNTASGLAAAISGGENNTASGDFGASVSGGSFNIASGNFGVSVSGGRGNTASGFGTVVSGGDGNTASGDRSVVSGGSGNTAAGNFSVVGGGRNRTAEGEADWVAGTLVEDE